MTLTLQAPHSHDDCRKIEANEIEWKNLASSSSDSDDLEVTSTSATVRDLEPARYEVKLTVRNEGGITTTSEVTVEFGIDQQSITVDVE